MPQYQSLVTLNGQGKVADAIAGGSAVNITHLAVGDGNGLPVTPLETATQLVHEVWRGAVLSVSRDPSHPTQVIINAEIPIGAGPFVIREMGLIASDGSLFAIQNTPEIEKSTAAQGATQNVTVNFRVVVATSANITVTVDAASMIYVAGLGRVPFISIDGFVTSPPGSPVAGALVVVGADPTGGFSGLAHKFAQWNGSLWVNAVAPLGTVVCDVTTGRYWKRTADAWVEWKATAAEIDTGTEPSKILVPSEFAGWINLAGATAAAASTGPLKDRIGEAMARYASGGRVYACAGSANAYTLTAKGAFIVPKSPFDGQRVEFVVNHTNTGAATATFAGVTKAIRTWDDQALAGGELVLGRPTSAIYDPAANSAAGALLIMPWANAAEVLDPTALPNRVLANVSNRSGFTNNVFTEVAAMTATQEQLDAASTFNGSRITMGGDDAGLWLVMTTVIMTTEEVVVSLYKNGSRYLLGNGDGYINSTEYGRYVQMVGLVPMVATDYLSVYVYQRNAAGNSKTASSVEFYAIKIPAI